MLTVWSTNKRLFKQADLFIELAHLAFDNLFHHLRRFAGSSSLRAVNVLLALESFGRDVFLAHEFRIAGSNVHRDVVHQFLEIIGAGHEVAFAIYFRRTPIFPPA